MGLLDDFSNFAKTPEGQGLLSAAFGGLAGARRGAPLNSIGNAGLAGLQGYAGALDREQQAAQIAEQSKLRGLQMQGQQLQMQNQQLQLDKATRDAATAKKIDDLRQQFTIPAKPASAGGLDQSLLPEDMRIGKTAVAPMPSIPQGFDAAGYGNALWGVDTNAAFDWQQKSAKDNSPISVNAGDSLIDRHTLKPIFTAPAKPEPTDAKIKQWEYAVKNNGYKGTLADWVAIGPALMAQAAAPLRAAQTAGAELENGYKYPTPPTAQSFSVTAPNGKVYSFADQKSLNNFKMKAGIK